MKKFLSLTIALLMLFSCISVSAETTNSEMTNESVLLEHALSTGALFNGITETPEPQYTFRDFGTVGEYSLCYMAGTLTHEVDYNTTIGNYKISTTREQLVNPLALYLVKGETVYDFNSDAYNNGIINEEELDQIISLINQNITDDIFRGWSIKELTNESVLLEHALSTGALFNGTTETPEPQYTFRDFGTVGEYSLCYIAGTLTHEVDYNTIIGNYKFSTRRELLVNPLGLYLVKGETVYDFNSEAYDKGIIDQDDLERIISLIDENIEDDVFRGWSYRKLTNESVLFEYAVSSGAILDWTPENGYIFRDFGKVGEYSLCYLAGSVYHEVYYNTTIGNYKISTTREQLVNPLALYLVKGETIYNFDANAYDKGIISKEELDMIISTINKNITDDVFIGWSISEVINKEDADKDDANKDEDNKQDTPQPIKPDATVKKSQIKAGEKVNPFKVVNPENEKVTYTPKNSKIATVNGKGYVTGLKKGTAKFVVKVGKKSFTCSIKVTSDPKLTKDNKKVKTITVVKKKTVKVRIVGKAKGVKNTYKNTSKAKVISNRNAEVIKIKGLKKGTTNLKITVNGKKMNLRVKVK